MDERKYIWQCRGAWILVIVAIVFWLWFGIGSAISEDDGWFNWLMHLLIPGGVFILSAIVAWRWDRIGGVLFVIEGACATAVVVMGLLADRLLSSTVLLMLLTLALPPLIAGILFLICANRCKEAYLIEQVLDEDG
jgi:cytochrome bd-type quinol oxidase subunit 1